MDTPVDLTRGKTRVGFMRKCLQSAVSFTARQTFAKLTGVDEKRELMGAHTALSRKIQPRYEKIDADLLTPRQREILRLVSIGHTNREIADVLEISVRTVEVHRFNLMRRLNVRNVAQLFRRALQLGLLAAPRETCRLTHRYIESFTFRQAARRAVGSPSHLSSAALRTPYQPWRMGLSVVQVIMATPAGQPTRLSSRRVTEPHRYPTMRPSAV